MSVASKKKPDQAKRLHANKHGVAMVRLKLAIMLST
jgi:hypothetical protein